MSVMNIIDRIKICSCIEKYGLAGEISRLPESAVMQTLTDNDDVACLELLAELDTEAQLNILGNPEIMAVYQKVYDTEVDEERLSALFGGSGCITGLAGADSEQIKRVLLCMEVPKEYMCITLKYPEVICHGDCKIFYEGLNIVVGHAGLTEDWCMENYALVCSGIITDEYFLSRINDYKGVLEELSGSVDLQKLLSLIYEAGADSVTQEMFEQLAGNPGKMLKALKSVLTIVPKEKKKSFIECWVRNGRAAEDLKVIKRNSKGSYDYVDNLVQYTAFCYSEAVDFDVPDYQIELVLYAIRNKKKKFLDVIRQGRDTFYTTEESSILYYPVFYQECVDIDALTQEDFKDLTKMTNRSSVDYLSGNSLTFKEFKLLYNSKSKIIDLYFRLEVEPVERKLEIIEEFNNSVSSMDDVCVDRLPKYLREKKLSEWRSEEFGHIRNISYNMVVKLLTYYGDLQRFIKDIRTQEEAERICSNIQAYRDMLSIAEVREAVIGVDEDWQLLKSKLQLTDEFVNQNKDRVSKFILQNGAHIAYSYLCMHESQSDDVKKLVIAELMDRFNEMKYQEGDLVRELGAAVDEKTVEVWQENASIQDGAVRVWEEDGFLPAMRIGIIPVRTRLAYDSRGSSECLLANFDANKKIIFVSDQGEIMLCAVLAFTKGNSLACHGRELAFCDITKQPARTRFVLFLDRAYCSLEDEGSKQTYFRLMFDMLREKAGSMGAVFVCSASYGSWQHFLVQIGYCLYVTASRTGCQYIDDFGCLTQENEGVYLDTQLLVHNEDLKLL